MSLLARLANRIPIAKARPVLGLAIGNPLVRCARSDILLVWSNPLDVMSNPRDMMSSTSVQTSTYSYVQKG
jgi:hypothetical protein